MTLKPLTHLSMLPTRNGSMILELPNKLDPFQLGQPEDELTVNTEASISQNHPSTAGSAPGFLLDWECCDYVVASHFLNLPSKMAIRIFRVCSLGTLMTIIFSQPFPASVLSA